VPQGMEVQVLSRPQTNRLYADFLMGEKQVKVFACVRACETERDGVSRGRANFKHKIMRDQDSF
jgi:hypothetical protein